MRAYTKHHTMCQNIWGLIGVVSTHKTPNIYKKIGGSSGMCEFTEDAIMSINTLGSSVMFEFAQGSFYVSGIRTLGARLG